MLQLSHDELVQLKDRTTIWVRYILITLWIPLIISSVCMFVMLVFVRKRREFPYVTIPLSFAISAVIGVVLVMNLLIREE